MKTTASVFVLLSAFFSLGLSQGYFPLQKGNQWDFGYLDYPPHVGYQFDFSIRVVGDTLMPNSKQYAIVVGRGNISFKRQEGNLVYNYTPSGDVVEHDFTYNDGDTTALRLIPNDTILTVVHVGFGEIFGRNLKSWSYATDAVHNLAYEPSSFTITDSIGYTYFASSPGEYDYCMGVRVDGKTYGTITSIPFGTKSIPSSFALLHNYPNPFNPTTQIEFVVPNTSFTTLRIFDLLGQKITTLVSERLSEGHYTRTWDASRFPSGVYFCVIHTGQFSQTIKLLLQK
jgi:Secretion system C-terminal sorting domain